jgi:hypothetical protein
MLRLDVFKCDVDGVMFGYAYDAWGRRVLGAAGHQSN